MKERSAVFSMLVIDDDPSVLSVFRRLLRDLPVRGRFAESAEQGMELVEAEVPELIIADYRLRGLDGLSFLERVHARYPLVKRILHTGEAVMRTAIGIDVPVLAKPCPPDSLRELLLAVVADTGRG